MARISSTRKSPPPPPPSEFDIDSYGDKLFGRRYRTLLKPHYVVVSTAATIFAAIFDFLKNLYPGLIYTALGMSLLCLALGGIWYLRNRTQGAGRATAYSGIAAFIFGSVATAPYLQAGDANSITEMVPLTAAIQRRLDELVTGVKQVSDDTRDIKRNVNEIAKAQKISMPSAIRQRFVEAMKDGNGDELIELSTAGYPSDRIGQILQQKDIAGQFFRNSADDESSSVWLGKLLDSGVSPDLIVSRSELPDEGILVSAFRNGNFPAVETILRHGANPHAYQDVLYHPAELPFFISPISSVIESEDFAPEQKKEIARLMIKNGLVIPSLVGNSNGMYGGFWVDGAIAWLKTNGIEYSPITRPCPKPAGLCERIEYASGRECDFTRIVPTTINLNRSYGIEIDRTFVKALVGVYGGRSFYLANSPGYNGQVSLVSVGADQQKWSIVKYESVQGDFCEEKTKGANTFGCWQNTNLHFNITNREFPYGEQVGFCGASPSN